jgi:YDG domain
MGIPTATITGSVTKMYDGTTSAPGATLSGTVNNAITGDSFSFDISSLTFSYAYSQSGVNSVRVAVPANYVPTLTGNSVSKPTDYTLQPFTIAPATGYIIPVVTVSIPSIAPAITAAAPASTASTASTGNASTGGGAGGDNASKGDVSPSSGSGSSGSNNSADPAGDKSQ